MQASLTLHGQRVRLRTTTEADRDPLVAIRSTPEVRRRWHGEDLAAEFDEDLHDDHALQLTVESTETGRVIGMIQFSEEDDPDYRHASIDIYIDPAVHRQGYATDAITALVRYLFTERGHHRLTIDPAADNSEAIACYAGVGFKPAGIMRAYERQPDGTWSDGLLMDLLSVEWEAAIPLAARLPEPDELASPRRELGFFALGSSPDGRSAADTDEIMAEGFGQD